MRPTGSAVCSRCNFQNMNRRNQHSSSTFAWTLLCGQEAHRLDKRKRAEWQVFMGVAQERLSLSPITDLGPIFRDLVENYHQDETGMGELISWLLQEDWEIFSERILGEEQEVIGNTPLQDMVVSILLAGTYHKELMETGIDYRGSFTRREPYHSTLEENWEEDVAKLPPGSQEEVPVTREDSLETEHGNSLTIREDVSGGQ